MYATDFLNRLGLDQDADERAIKRAYARELKLIDQETDAAGFQLLRQAYEIALHWVKREQADPADTPVAEGRLPVAPVPAPAQAAAPHNASTGENPQELAQAVFEEFLGICGRMAEQGNTRDAGLWRKHLLNCIADERLLNISARANFEFLIAQLLANGWRPGHEGIFVAARGVFGWEDDRRRLMEFGYTGGWLNQAIEECAMFSHQSAADCSGQADAVQRVREDAAPSKGELLAHVPHLRNMVARFPVWTSVIASNERIQEWAELERALPAWRRRLRFGRKTAANSTSDSGISWWKIALVLLALKGLVNVFTSAPSSTPAGFYPPRFEAPAAPLTEQQLKEEEAYKRAAGRFYMPPGTRTLDPKLQQESLPRIPTAGRALNQEELDTITNRVDFHAPHIKPGTYKVEFLVHLNEHGAVETLTKKTSSGLPVLDKHVEDAVRSAAPFSSEVRRRFSVTFTRTYSAPKKSPAPEQAPAQ